MKHQLDAQHCAGFISAESLYMFRALAPETCRVTAEIKPAQCCIKLVFHLTYTMMHGSTKLKFRDHFTFTYSMHLTVSEDKVVPLCETSTYKPLQDNALCY